MLFRSSIGRFHLAQFELGEGRQQRALRRPPQLQRVLERLGGRVVGVLDEVYPSFGPLVSDLWIAERKDCIACLETTTTPGAQRSLARARKALAYLVIFFRSCSRAWS